MTSQTYNYVTAVF